jgi:uncharacterized membrane protein YdjX (TVP38/TMEM64 family)
MINFKKLKFYTLLLLVIISLTIVIFPFFSGYDPAYYKALLDYFNIPQFIYLGWVILATATTLPISAAMVAGIVYFSFSEAMLLTVMGVLIGTISTFYASRWLGKEFVQEDFNIKGKTKLHIFNELMHKSSFAYVTLLTCVYAFPSNLAYMIAGVTGMSFWQMLVIVIIGNLSTVFAVGVIILGVLNTNISYVLGGAALLLVVNIMPITMYYKEMKKLVVLIFSKKAYQRLEKIEKLEKRLEKDVGKAEKIVKEDIKKIEHKFERKRKQ